jgi:hypothetical protein
MVEQLWGPFEKFVDWWQCAVVMLLRLPVHNSGAMPPVHELFKRPSKFTTALFHILKVATYHSRARRTWKDNIRMDVKETGWEGVKCVRLAKVDRWNPIRASTIRSRSRHMRFLDFSNHEKGAQRKISKWSTVCSTFSRCGWSVVRSASVAKGGTSKRDRHHTSTKFRLE